MKKIIGLVVLSIILIGCGSEPNIENSFKSAVNEVYKTTAGLFYYSDDGIESTHPNRIKGSNEQPVICGDYVMEFMYYWNEVLNYDSIYGKAYHAVQYRIRENVMFLDINFLPKETFNFRNNDWEFASRIYNSNDKNEFDSIYRDGESKEIVYKGNNFLHFGRYATSHAWVVIYFNDNWWTCDPTWFDTGSSGNNYVPHVIKFE